MHTASQRIPSLYTGSVLALLVTTAAPALAQSVKFDFTTLSPATPPS